MSIPQGLILYKAQRHHERHPMNIKQRSYSDKMVLSTEALKTKKAKTTKRKNQPQTPKWTRMIKMVRYLHLSLEMSAQKKLPVIYDFCKFHRVKKCSIHLSYETKSTSKKSEGLAVPIIQKVFKTLKDLDHVEMKDLDAVQKNSKIFKNLIFQRSLQKLVINPLKYSEDVQCLETFMKLCKKASRRKAWPHLESFRVKLFYEKESHKKSPGSLKNLLKFIQDLKSCKSLYKQLHLGIILPENASSKEGAAFKEILKISPPLTQISAYQSEHIISLFDKAENLTDLHSLSLRLLDVPPDYVKTDPLEDFPALQEMNLFVNCTYPFDDEGEEWHFNYVALEKIQELTNLTSLSLHFDGEPGTVDDMLIKALLKLTKLTHLKLQFTTMTPFEDQFEEYDEEEEPPLLSWHWLKDVFQAIGKRKKLQELSLDFETWGLEDASQHFKSLCQALGNLNHLSSLRLRIRDEEFIKDQDLCVLASHLSKIKRLECLSLHLGSGGFKSKTFIVLMDSIMKNLPILSELDFELRSFEVTKECYQVVYEAIHQMKCLNRVNLVMGNPIVKGVDLALLNAEIHKRMTGSIKSSEY